MNNRFTQNIINPFLIILVNVFIPFTMFNQFLLNWKKIRVGISLFMVSHKMLCFLPLPSPTKSRAVVFGYTCVLFETLYSEVVPLILLING